MDNRRTSELVLQRLRDSARQMARPEVRNSTINRLQEACNAIESGIAADLVKAVFGKDDGLRLNPRINPSTVEKYVKARGKKDHAWTGPTRVTIAKDSDLLAYVQAREDERLKPHLPKRPSSKRRQIEDAISNLPSMEIRMDLRHELENGRRAQRNLELLTKGLRKIPGIDVDRLLHNSTASQIEAVQLMAPTGIAPQVIPLKERDMLRQLVTRLTDRDEMSRAGLEIENNRVRVAATKRALVKPGEMEILKRLADIAESFSISSLTEPGE